MAFPSDDEEFQAHAKANKNVIWPFRLSDDFIKLPFHHNAHFLKKLLSKGGLKLRALRFITIPDTAAPFM